MRRLGSIPALLLVACATAGPSVAPRPRVQVPAPRVVPAAIDPACGSDVAPLVSEERTRRPASTSADLYKLVHEALLGPAHLLVEPEQARARLADELAAAGPPRADERLAEELDEASGTMRIHLRRWRFARGTINELWPVVVASAAVSSADARLRLPACLRAAAAVAPQDFPGYVQAREAEGFPAVRHSDAYRAAYAPSYRVVLRRHLPGWVTAPPPNAG